MFLAGNLKQLKRSLTSAAPHRGKFFQARCSLPQEYFPHSRGCPSAQCFYSLGFPLPAAGLTRCVESDNMRVSFHLLVESEMHLMAILAQLQRFFLPSKEQGDAMQRYAALVEKARSRVFYEEMGVPDTLDGRFEMIALHLALALETLLATEKRMLMEAFIADMDRNLREMGAGDMGVGRRVQAMVSAFYGRQEAYAKAADNLENWQAALRRNAYGTVQDANPEQVQRLAEYAISQKTFRKTVSA